MKYQLILLEQPIIVEDNVLLKELDFYISYSGSNNIHQWKMGNGIHEGKAAYAKKIIAISENQTTSLAYKNAIKEIPKEIQDKVKSDIDKIKGTTKLPSIDFNGLEEQLGIIDVEKLAINKYGIDELFDSNGNDIMESYREGFIEGFKTDKSFNDKMFSLEDIKIAMEYIIDKETFYGDTVDDAINMQQEIIQNYLNILQQPKVFDVEIEMETWSDGICKYPNQKTWLEPKITNNSIKITKIL